MKGTETHYSWRNKMRKVVGGEKNRKIGDWRGKHGQDYKCSYKPLFF